MNNLYIATFIFSYQIMQLLLSCNFLLLISASTAYCDKQLRARILQKQCRQILQVLNQIQTAKKEKPKECHSAVEQNYPSATCCPRYMDCNEIYNAGYQKSGTYIISLFYGLQYLAVHCDMTTVGKNKHKGWISIQKRWNGKLSFEHGWQEYFEGFGSPDNEHWIGVLNIHFMSNQRMKKSLSHNTRPNIRIDMKDWDAVKAQREYRTFGLTDDRGNYAIDSIGRLLDADYYGNIKLFEFCIGSAFITRDCDRNAHLIPGREHIKSQTGGWWLENCYSNLNGRYPTKSQKNLNTIMYVSNWQIINPKNTALKQASMMLQWPSTF